LLCDVVDISIGDVMADRTPVFNCHVLAIPKIEHFAQIIRRRNDMLKIDSKRIVCDHGGITRAFGPWAKSATIHRRRAEQECRGCGRKSSRACAGDANGRAGSGSDRHSGSKSWPKPRFFFCLVDDLRKLRRTSASRYHRSKSDSLDCTARVA
jgi:hypothetical protein